MPSWYVAPSLVALLSDVNDRWPNRSKTSDGTIGDAAHSSRESQHNPADNPAFRGAVTAADITTAGIDKQLLIDTLKRDRRVWYVIHDRKIWSRTHGFKTQPYNGSNPHTSHIHVSLVQSKAAVNDKAAWLGKKPPKPVREESHYQRLVRLAHERYVYIGKLKAKLRAANRRNR